MTLMRICLPILTIFGTGVSATAQSVISAHSGVVHYVEGRVLLDKQEVKTKFGQFPDLKNNQELRTEEGRAEVLLTPGVFLRLSENSAVRMVSNRLSDTKIEFLGGSALIECAEILKDNSIVLLYRDRTITLEKHGLYRLDSEPARFRVYDGEAIVSAGTDRLTLKRGKESSLQSQVLQAEKFDAKAGDELYRWSSRRANYLAIANVSAAKSLRDTGASWGTSDWRWNPYFGMFTYIPCRGSYYSPFGYSFWSPLQVMNYYRPIYYGYSSGNGGLSAPSYGYRSDLGYTTVPRTADNPGMSGGTTASSSGSMSVSGGSMRGGGGFSPGASAAPASDGGGASAGDSSAGASGGASQGGSRGR